ncbi:MAG: hypothetical protein M1528_00335 [Candidatus Marsarchaeota archaeon]|nr:hypothetical protein [Candidatus Marsarchaeota archaeon]MCL5114976.1 hypothetical protein [Candidatus Marsarchaeota archaeon]
MVVLDCSCEVTDDGRFVVGIACKGCTECNIIAELHPFGIRRISNIVLE